MFQAALARPLHGALKVTKMAKPRAQERAPVRIELSKGRTHTRHSREASVHRVPLDNARGLFTLTMP